MKILVGILVAFIAFAGIIGMMYVSNHNKAVSHEEGIIAQYDSNRNALSALTLSVMESAQVPEMARDDLNLVISNALEGRYGENGSNAMFQAMSEAYPGELSSELYTNIQNQIESGRRNFANNQDMLLGKVQGYRTDLRSFVSGAFMGAAGFPEIDLDKYTIVVSQQAQDAFENGVDGGMKLRGE
jgi:hypothetical protein